MQMHLLELVYIPAIRLFQRYKTMNANAITASNGPITNYHCIGDYFLKKLWCCVGGGVIQENAVYQQS